MNGSMDEISATWSKLIVNFDMVKFSPFLKVVLRIQHEFFVLGRLLTDYIESLRLDVDN